MLEVEGLNAYYGAAHVLQDVSLTIGAEPVAQVDPPQLAARRPGQLVPDDDAARRGVPTDPLPDPVAQLLVEVVRRGAVQHDVRGDDRALHRIRDPDAAGVVDQRMLQQRALDL